MDKKQAQELLKGLYSIIETRVPGTKVEHVKWDTVYKALDAFIAGPAIEPDASPEGKEEKKAT